MKKIGFLLSGSGSTLENFILAQKDGILNAEIAVVISSKKEAYGIERAKKYQIPCFVVEYKEYNNNLSLYSQKITEILLSFQCEWVVMGGFLSLYLVPECFTNKVFNIHPSLIPAFCGKGMYGKKVHRAVLESGVKITGCTVHLVDNHYDNGPIIAQKAVEVLDNDTEETLAARVQEEEKKIYPRVVNDFIHGLYFVSGKRVFKKKF